MGPGEGMELDDVGRFVLTLLLERGLFVPVMLACIVTTLSWVMVAVEDSPWVAFRTPILGMGKRFTVCWLALLVLSIYTTLHNSTWEDDRQVKAKSTQQCQELFITESSLAGLCRRKPNSLTCRYERMTKMVVADALSWIGDESMDALVVRHTRRLEVKCHIWARTTPKVWGGVSTTSYSDQACACRVLSEVPPLWYNVYLALFTWTTFIFSMGGLWVLFLAFLAAVFRYCFGPPRRVNSGSTMMYTRTTPHGTLRVKQVEVTAKQAANPPHLHACINRLRKASRVMMSSLASQGQTELINFYGSRQDIITRNGLTVYHIQTKSGYNYTRNDGADVFDTHENALRALEGRPGVATMVQDTVWYWTAAVAARAFHGRETYFNIRNCGIGKHEFRAPACLGGELETTVEDDGVTLTEETAGGERYSHPSLRFPNQDSFSVAHGNDVFCMTRLKVAHEDSVFKTFDKYTEHWRSVPCDIAPGNADYRLDQFFVSHVNTVCLLRNDAGTVVGAQVPTGGGVPRRLTDEEWDACHDVALLPKTVDWNIMAEAKLRRKGCTRDVKPLRVVSYYLHQQQLADPLLSSERGVIALLHFYVTLGAWHIAERLLCRLSIFLGFSTFYREADTWRIVPLSTLASNPIGSNSQNAGTPATGAVNNGPGANPLHAGGPGGGTSAAQHGTPAAQGAPPKNRANDAAPADDSAVRGAPDAAGGGPAPRERPSGSAGRPAKPGPDNARKAPTTQAPPQPDVDRGRNGVGGKPSGVAMAKQATPRPKAAPRPGAGAGIAGSQPGVPNGKTNQAATQAAKGSKPMGPPPGRKFDSPEVAGARLFTSAPLQGVWKDRADDQGGARDLPDGTGDAGAAGSCDHDGGAGAWEDALSRKRADSKRAHRTRC